MFYKIIDVHTAVFRYFSESLEKDLGVHVRYAHRSSQDYTEEQEQQIYPCVAIQDYFPTPKENWWIEHKAFHRATSLNGEIAYLYYLPLWMQFRYDVSTASKSFFDHQQLQQWFLEHVVADDEITLQPIIVGDMDAGEPISISTRVQDIPRTDGVFETNYEVTFDVWLYARSPISVSAIQDVVIHLNRVKPSTRGEDFYTLVAGEVSYKVPRARLTDYIARAVLEIDGYSGIRDISRKEYDALEVKDPNMIYIIW